MSRGRKRLVPEIIQTSLTDCGPAALKAVLEGFGIDVPYEAVRDRCRTDVDGTSIDALAALAGELGLEAHEMLVPRDAFLLPEADCIPAIVVTRSGAGALHFRVVWSVVGPLVQVMDPSSGRTWMRKSEFVEQMPDVDLPIEASTWRAWAGSERGLAPLRARMRAIGVGGSAAQGVIVGATRDASFCRLATLDAAVRMVASLVRADAVSSGGEASRLLTTLVARAETEADAIPRRFVWAAPSKVPGKLVLHGAVVVHFARRRGDPSPTHLRPPPALCRDGALPGELTSALSGATVAPLRILADLVRVDHPRAFALLAVAIVATALVTIVDAVLLRGVLEASYKLTLGYQRAAGALVLLAVAGLGLSLDHFVSSLVHRVGMGLELRLRVGLLEKLPRLEDRYLQSRPTSDMASRGHTMQLLREAPALAARVARAAATLVATTTGLLLIDPGGWPWALSAAAAAVAFPYLFRRPLAESGMRVRTHASALDRFYLDALLGVTPVRVHGAERAVQREHESLLVEWGRSARALHVQSSLLQSLQMLATTVFAVALVASYFLRGGALGSLLLLVYWALRLPAIGTELTLALVAMRDLGHVATRLFAPLGAPEVAAASDAVATTTRDAGAHVRFCDVTARVGGTVVLSSVSADLLPGTHVGVVGASGAGKSSLVALLLGFMPVSEGRVLVDGAPLTGDTLGRLRREIAWVDPAVHLFNRPLVDNIAFGRDDAGAATARLSEAMASADLLEVLEGLRDGMQTSLGENGVRLSGGQGQRVRLARALLGEGSRLVLLDEPFRGLERPRRRELLARARRQWAKATMLLVSHDVSDTVGLDRVLVLDGGRIVEDGSPEDLLQKPSRYRALVDADAALRDGAWSKERWRRATMSDGRLDVGGAA